MSAKIAKLSRRIADRMILDWDFWSEWYGSLGVGSVVHYNYGFNCWVRCRVVVATERGGVAGLQTILPGEFVLEPIALVGKGWDRYSLAYCSHNERFRPNPLNMYEAGSVSTAKLDDPRGMRARKRVTLRAGGVV